MDITGDGEDELIGYGTAISSTNSSDHAGMTSNGAVHIIDWQMMLRGLE